MSEKAGMTFGQACDFYPLPMAFRGGVMRGRVIEELIAGMCFGGDEGVEFRDLEIEVAVSVWGVKGGSMVVGGKGKVSEGRGGGLSEIWN